MNNSICHSNLIVLSIARWVKNHFLLAHRAKPPLRLLSAIVIGLLQAAPLVSTHAQGATAITPTTGAGNLGTNVIPSGNVYGITGGKPVGSNLFHSFTDFSVAKGDIAQFQTTTLLPNATLSNILARITGGNPSSIFGTVDSSSYYPNANLFLMNPNGILFGPGAHINVGGMAHFTTADYLRLADNIRFEAVPGPQDALLSTASVAAFGFLGSNPAAIAVQGSKLTVANGTGLSLVGGNRGFTYTDPDTGATASVPDGVTMTGGRLSAPGGQINLASVASAGEVLNGTLVPAPNINGNSFTAMGNISLSQGATLNVRGDAAGTVRIRGGQFVIADATISADTINSNGALTALDIKLTGNLLISDTRGLPAMTARTTGHGNAGAIQINSANLAASSTSPASTQFALIDTHTSGAGRAGNINIMTGNLQSSYQGPGNVQFTDSGTAGPGHGGDVTISAQSVTLEGTGINTGDSVASLLNQNASGSAGNVTINADRIMLLNSTIDTSAVFASHSAEQAGSVTLKASDINLTQSVVSGIGFGGGGAFSVTADRLIMDGGSQLNSLTAVGPGGGILVNARVVELLNGSQLATTIAGNGQAGDIRVTATDHLTLSTSPLNQNPSGFFSNSTGQLGGGYAGAIVVTTPRLNMTGGSRINTATLSSGPGGDVTINSTNSVSISGEFPSLSPEPIFGIGTIHPSGVFTGTVGGACSGPCGDAGRISITTGSLVLGNGAQIDSGTSSTGRGGNISIHATISIAISGTLSDGSPVGIFSSSIGTSPDAGSGGNIALTDGQSVTISNSAAISASSSGPGDAGNIGINAGQRLDMRDSSITTQASQASGGNINIQAVDRVRLVNSSISTSVLGGSGSGGNITIDPNVVVLQNSQIIAQAVQGAGGNITITTPLFLADSTSLVSASSQFGLNGTVTIQSPTSNLSGSLGTLTSTPSQAQSLLTQRCAALANGQASSFVVAGREQLPADPGGWLSGPIALAGIDAERFGEGTVAEGTSNLEPQTSGLLANDRVSLRRLTPAGFLIANFADSEATGCHS